MITLDVVKNQVEQLATLIIAPRELLPTYGRSKDNGHPHIEIRGTTYHYIVVERGQEFEHRTTFELDELLYWIFQDVTFSMASSYELAHRNSQTDSRRVLFSYQIDLLSSLNKQWKERCEQEIAEILKHYPYIDAN